MIIGKVGDRRVYKRPVLAGGGYPGGVEVTVNGTVCKFDIDNPTTLVIIEELDERGMWRVREKYTEQEYALANDHAEWLENHPLMDVEVE